MLDISTTSLNVSGSIVGLNIGLSGSNFTSLVTTTGATISNTRTGSSSTNVALTLTASGGTTNTALNVTAGNVTIGTITSGTWNGTAIGVAYGGTGVSTSGTTSQIAVGGGTLSPIVWTTATGTGAPVRADSPTFTTATLFPDGAAATPALRFASDTDTGMYLYGANKIGWSANSNVRMSMEPGILRLGTSMTATCSAGSYLLIEATDSAGICLSRTTATTGKYSFFTKGTGDFGFYDELNARYCINIIKASGLVEAPLGLSSGGTLGVTGATTLTGLLTANGGITLGDAQNIAFNTTTGTKIGAATTQKLSFWNATPIVQPTTAVASATVVHLGGGTNLKTDDTFDGYTLAQVVKALRNAGLLA